MKVPKCFLGRPKLWDVYQHTPEERWSVSTAAMIAYLKPEESEVLKVPAGLRLSYESGIVIYNILLDMSKDGLPFITKLIDLADKTDYHRTAIGHTMSDLRAKGVIDYKSLGCAGLMVKVVVN